MSRTALQITLGKAMTSRIEFEENKGKAFFALTNKDYGEELGPEELLRLMAMPRPVLLPDLAGRGAAAVVALDSGRKVLLRCLQRGGFIRRLIRRSFLVIPGSSLAETRPIHEARILARLREAGVSVPVPAAAFVRRLPPGLFYRGLLATEYIPGAVNLLHLLQEVKAGSASEEAVRGVSYGAGKEARDALLLGVLHRDLHLGNVLRDENGMVYLIDFDKAFAGVSKAGFEQGARYLEERWRRSVLKHAGEDTALAAQMEALFSRGLWGR